MKICIIKPPSSTNLGNGFFNDGNSYVIDQLFPGTDISVVEFFDSCEEYRGVRTAPFTKSTMDFFKRNDLLILFGGCAVNPSLYDKVIKVVMDTGVPFMPFSLGGCVYNDSEKQVALKMVERSVLFVTRDSYMFNFIENYDQAFNGIDGGFFAGDYYRTPNEQGNYAVSNIDSDGRLCTKGKANPLKCDNSIEYYEKLKKDYEEAYIVTNNNQRNMSADREGVLGVFSAEALWSLFKNASKVVTTRAHTTVCCLTEGTEVEYQGYMDKRALGIFENVEIDIKKGDHLNVQGCLEKISIKKQEYLTSLKNKLEKLGVTG